MRDRLEPALGKKMRNPIRITHRKIAGLDPLWAEFHGTSLIFRPIGAAEAAPEGGTARLYQALAALIHDRGAEKMRKRGYCALPPASYHMTFSDLIHDGNVARVAPEVRAAFGPGEGIAPEARYPEPLRELVKDAGVAALDGLTFAFSLDGLAIRSGSALVAELRPVDPAGSGFPELEAVRERLDALLLARFGIESPSFRPHVTLGYFANKPLAARASSLVETFQARLRRQLEGATFTFADPTPCSFVDMAGFVPVGDGVETNRLPIT